MKNLKNISAQEQEFLDKVDALVGSAEASAADIASELEQAGIDPEELRRAAFQRIRSFANEKYTARGMNLPPRMSEALKQMRPPTTEEEKSAQSKKANTRVQDFLASLKQTGSALTAPTAFAPAYRNKQEETPDGDDELIRKQQEDLDSEGDE
jgi:hypothetical protein